MKVAIITDTHFGWKNDSDLFFNYFKSFYDEVFFPTLKERNIRHVLHGGDLFDRRKYVNFHILYRTRKEFLERLAPYETHIIIGNHDTYFRDTNDVNSVVELCNRMPNMQIYQEPAELELGGLKMLLLPWLNPMNTAPGLDFIKRSKATLLLGHLEITGFKYDRSGSPPCDHGLDRSIFKKFKRVLSGHFHTRQTDGNIEYLGSPYELTFADMGDDRGFHILDTETLETEFIQNPHKMFFKKVYDDRDESQHGAMLLEDFSLYENKFLKVVATHKTNPYLYEQIVDRINGMNPAKVDYIENQLVVPGVDSEDGDVEISMENIMADTRTILHTHIDAMELEIDKNIMKNVLDDLYFEAIALGKGE